MRRVAFFIVPTVVAFTVLGQVVASMFFQTGRFGWDDAQYVWAILAGSTVGLLAGTHGRLYTSAFYALTDTRTPLKFAALRVGLTTVLGYLACGQTARSPRRGASLGGGRTHRVGRTGRLGGIPAAAQQPPGPDRKDVGALRLPRQAVGAGIGGREASAG
jgi:hypothetical protein